MAHKGGLFRRLKLAIQPLLEVHFRSRTSGLIFGLDAGLGCGLRSCALT
jgi:hypothetical protein